MAKPYKMTPARRAALKKAQAASARKRKGKKNPKLAAAHRRSKRNVKIALGVQAGVLAAGVGTYYAMNRKPKKVDYSKARVEARNRINRRRALRASAAQLRGQVDAAPTPTYNRRQTAAYAIRTVFGRRR